MGESSESQPARHRMSIVHTSDVAVARRAARELARAIDFGVPESEEIALVVSELASNLVTHAGGGTLTLTPLTSNTRIGLQVESIDTGPGIPNAELAIRDGYSTAGSLGYGLGTVNRLMDELDITSQGRPQHGTRIVCTRWQREQMSTLKSCPLDIGAATRAYPGMALNGDTFIIKRWGESVLVGVIDGLGHGQYAHRAAQKAREYVENHYDQPVMNIFRGTNRTCRATRGVVMALARFDWGQQKMTFATIGNIEARVLSNRQPINLMIRRGIIGANAPNPVVTEHDWEPNNMIVLHSDGLTTRWRWDDFRHVMTRSATEMAQEMLLALAKDNDDATVVVVKKAT